MNDAGSPRPPLPVPDPPSTWLLLARIHPGWWFPLGAALAAVDYLTGHVIVPPVFASVVTVAAWYSGVWTGAVLGLVLPSLRVLSAEYIQELTLSRFVVGLLTLVFLAFIAGRLGRHERALQLRITELESLLPMCMFCKSIRNSADEWERLEHYMASSGQDVTHGICPPCAAKHYPEDHHPPRAEQLGAGVADAGSRG